jgi:hypothetical protein
MHNEWLSLGIFLLSDNVRVTALLLHYAYVTGRYGVREPGFLGSVDSSAKPINPLLCAPARP